MGECFFWYRSTQVVPDNTETRVRVLNGPFSATTQVSRYQTEKVKPIWILLKQETVGGSGYQLGHMQVCILLQTDNHTSTPPLSFLQASCPSCRPINSVKAMKVSFIPDNGPLNCCVCVLSCQFTIKYLKKHAT